MQSLIKTTSTAILTGIVSAASILGAGTASAAGIQGISIGGSAPSDYYVYGVNGSNQTVRIPSTVTNAQSVLGGNAASPTGNVELAASSETAGFDFTKNTTLSGVLVTSQGSQPITLSSLTIGDWQTVLPSGKTLQQQWFADLMTKYPVLNASQQTTAYSAFMNPNFKLLQRLSDPNISYVNSAADGSVKIGLAGFLNANPLLGATAPVGTPIALASILNALSNTPMQASEVVKVTYAGKTSYLYGFTATASGLVAADDGRSHTGNYEFYLSAPPSRSVPVPAAFLGVAAAGAVGGLMMKRRKASQA